MRVLIYRTGRLGDFLVAVPAIRLIRESYPGATVTLLTTASTRRRFAEKTRAYADPKKPLPWLDFVVPALVDEVLALGSLWDLAGLIALRREIQKRRFGAVFLLPFSTEPFANRLRKLLFFRAMGVSGPIWGLRDGKGRLRPPPRPLHQVETALAAARQSPVVARQPEEGAGFDLSVSRLATDWAEEQLGRRHWSGRKIVALFPGNTYAHKRWSPENFAAVGAQLAEDPETVFLLVGSSDERTLAEPIARALPGRCWNACGETNVQQLAALLGRSALFLGNDGGPGHLAAGLGTPCVSLMSSIHPPGRWEPWGSRSKSLRHLVPCAGCGGETHCPTGTEDCIRGITIGETLGACRDLLNP